MANEREVKLGLRKATCSVTGERCECVSGGGCRNREPYLDRAPKESILGIRTAKLLLAAAVDWLDEADEMGGSQRRYPLPEARQWRRELESIISDIEEVLK